MSPLRRQLDRVIDFLPETEQLLLLEIAMRFIDDDIATADDLRAIEQARLEYERGETVSIDEIDWN